MRKRHLLVAASMPVKVEVLDLDVEDGKNVRFASASPGRTNAPPLEAYHPQLIRKAELAGNRRTVLTGESGIL